MHHQIKVHLKFPDPATRDETRTYMCRCPLVLEGTGDGDQDLTLHFSVPDEKLGWAKALGDNPQFVGANQGRFEILAGATDRSGELKMTPADTPPCGAKCPTCQFYLKKCGGCPVTPFYKAGYKFE